MYKSVQISKLLPNPYRNVDEYPLIKEKIDKLRGNFQSTGFWGNIVARPVAGGYEIAYGHHRLEALKQEYGGRKKVEVIIRELSNDDMLKMMVQENDEEFQTNAFVEMENVEQTLKAAAVGEITLPPIGKNASKSKLRNCPALAGQFEYSEQQVAEFLGWTKSHGPRGSQPNERCKVAFAMLDAVSEGLITRKQLIGMKRQAAHEIVKEAIKTKREVESVAKEKEAEAKIAEKEGDKSAAARLKREAEKKRDSAKAVAKQQASEQVKEVREGKASVRDVRESGAKNRSAQRPKGEQRTKEAGEHLASLSRDVSKMLNGFIDKRFDSFVKLLKMDCEIDESSVRELLTEVIHLRMRCEKFETTLKSWRPKASGGRRSVKAITG